MQMLKRYTHLRAEDLVLKLDALPVEKKRAASDALKRGSMANRKGNEKLTVCH
jgi:hypothetical protein